jgi:hypothetical protein
MVRAGIKKVELKFLTISDLLVQLMMPHSELALS